MIKEATKTRKDRRYVKYAIKKKQLEELELLPVTNATKVHLKERKLKKTGKDQYGEKDAILTIKIICTKNVNKQQARVLFRKIS